MAINKNLLVGENMKKIMLVGILLAQVLFAEKATIQNREFTTKEMEAQNKHIVQLAATEISKKLPQKIDEYTTLVSAQAKAQTLKYLFEVNIGDKSEKQVINKDTARMQRVITQGVCKNSQRFLDANIKLSYVYLNEKTKNQLFKIDISKHDCLKKGS